MQASLALHDLPGRQRMEPAQNRCSQGTRDSGMVFFVKHMLPDQTDQETTRPKPTRERIVFISRVRSLHAFSMGIFVDGYLSVAVLV